MKLWQRMGTLIASSALGLLVLLPATPSFADAARWRPRETNYHTQDFRRERRELWQDRAKIRQDQRELWRDQRAHRWGEVAQDRRALWNDRRELQRNWWDARYDRHPWW